MVTSVIAISPSSSSSSSSSLWREPSSPSSSDFKRTPTYCFSRIAHISLNRLYLPSNWAYQKGLFTSSLSHCRSCNSSFHGDGFYRLDQSNCNSCSRGLDHLPSSLHKRSLNTKLKVSATLVASHGQEEPFSASEGVGSPRWVFGEAIQRDLERRLPYYISDFADGFHPKSVASVFFLYFACLAPCIGFGGLLSHVTAGNIGVVETIVSTAGAGILYAFTAGQPLTLLGPTGLMVIFCGLLYKVTVRMGLPFLPVYGWVGIWSCVFLIALAAIGASDLIRHFTRFTDETFSALISLGYISEASKSIGNMFKQSSSYTVASTLLVVKLAGGTTCNHSHSAKELKVSGALAAECSLRLWSTAGYLCHVMCISSLFPFHPTPSTVYTFNIFHHLRTALATFSLEHSILGNYCFSNPCCTSYTSGVFRPGCLVAHHLIWWSDCQNITTRLVNNPEYQLTKGAGYHLDLAVLGVIMAICSCFGLPWMFASTVPSLSHVRSLATTSKSIHISGDNAEAPEEHIVGVLENRLTGILIHVCVGASLLLLSLLRLVPMPVIDGIFMYMGVTSLMGNQFVERLKLWFCDPHLYPQHEFTQTVPILVLHSFTALQLGCLAALWALKHSPYGITFPLLILALLPIRNYIAGSFVAPPYLEIMDAH